ncbi:MAG TPA: glycosyl hydrolase family 65 protein [Solirubrobacteraceae bacterium]|nr:glycosyl hydrolase family 65 protein [Solirubrobacteraceae bacterium]
MSGLRPHAAQRQAVRAAAVRPVHRGARRPGTFTFLTGEGGFLQTFLYGWSGFRWRADRIHLDPTLPDQWAASGLTLRGLAYQGRRFDVAIGAQQTTVTLDSGDPVPVEANGSTQTLSQGSPVTMATRRLQTSGCSGAQ